jgi:hypothetical protein
MVGQTNCNGWSLQLVKALSFNLVYWGIRSHESMDNKMMTVRWPLHTPPPLSAAA